MNLAAKPQAPATTAESAIARRLDRLLLWSQRSLLELARWILQNSGAWAPLDQAVQRALAPKIAKLGTFILALIVLKAALRAQAAYTFAASRSTPHIRLKTSSHPPPARVRMRGGRFKSKAGKTSSLCPAPLNGDTNIARFIHITKISRNIRPFRTGERA